MFRDFSDIEAAELPKKTRQIQTPCWIIQVATCVKLSFDQT